MFWARKNDGQILLTAYGAAGSVTGANFLLAARGKKILIDSGFFQGDPESEKKNWEPFPYQPSQIDWLLVTHAHADHIGRIPKLVRDGFRGVIYSTKETKEISTVMFDDALRLMTNESRNVGQPVLYEGADIDKALSLWREIPYHEAVSLGEDISFVAKDAGHILGSAMYEISIERERILFTGDLGNSPSPLLRDTELPAGTIYMVMESVYGDRNHESREATKNKLFEMVNRVIKEKGLLIIPAFSLERTQVILHDLNNMVESGRIPPVPVFLDSPLAIKVTEIYKQNTANFNERIRKELETDDIWNFPKLNFTLKAFDSAQIQKTPRPKIIIAGSGMSEGGRVISHEKKYLSDGNTTILLVGFQAPGTLGRMLYDGLKEVKIEGERYKVKANIEKIPGYSSHKDSDHLVKFVEAALPTLKKVFVAMGEPKASNFLAQRLRDELGVNAICPERGKSYQLV